MREGEAEKGGEGGKRVRGAGADAGAYPLFRLLREWGEGKREIWLGGGGSGMGRKEGLTGTLPSPPPHTQDAFPAHTTPACTFHECAINVDTGCAPAPKSRRDGERDEALVAADVEHLPAPEPAGLHQAQSGVLLEATQGPVAVIAVSRG